MIGLAAAAEQRQGQLPTEVRLSRVCDDAAAAWVADGSGAGAGRTVSM